MLVGDGRILRPRRHVAQLARSTHQRRALSFTLFTEPPGPLGLVCCQWLIALCFANDEDKCGVEDVLR